MKPDALWRECAGEAHFPGNAYIDTCSGCVPFWHWYPVCPNDGVRLSMSGWCVGCLRYCDASRTVLLQHLKEKNK